MFNKKNYNVVMTLAVLLILIIPVGIANIVLGYFVNESPCTLCWWERMCMILVGVMGIFILRYGPRLRYTSLVYISAMAGLYMSLRHTGSHFRDDIGQGFGSAIMGAHTYSWGAFVFFVTIVVITVLNIFYARDKQLMKEISENKLFMNTFSKFTKVVVFIALIVVASNAFQAFFTNGLPPYTGKGNPQRMTLNLSRAASMWTTDEWSGVVAHWSFRGNWHIQTPYVAGLSDASDYKFDLNTKDSVITNTKASLSVVKSFPLGLKIKGNLRGLSYDAASNTFGLITSAHSIYLTNDALNKINYFADVDTVDGGSNIGTIVGSTFYGKNSFLITGLNKTIFGVKVVDKVPTNDYMQWRNFHAHSKNLVPTFGVDYPKVKTVRAKMSYILAMAKNPAEKYLYMINITNKTVKKLVLMKVSTKDNRLSAETDLSVANGVNLKGDLNKLYITSMSFYKNKILAISKEYNSLLVIDKDSAQIVSAYALPKIGDIFAIAVKGDKLVIASKKDNIDMINILNNPIAI